LADQVTDGTWEVVGFEATDMDGDKLEFNWLGTVVP